MYLFHNDYNEICHPNVLKKMQENIGVQMNGYGEDESCHRAACEIRRLCDRPDAAVHFLVGGTQTNLTVIAAALRPHQAVLAADCGHIHVHETGAIEATGHKVITLESKEGKITANQISSAVDARWEDANHEHIPQPKLVYVSQPTELGTMYSLAELHSIADVCKKYGLYLFVDGARLGYALVAKGNDVNLPDLARLADVFYIGGTKVGAMFGEAVVIVNSELQRDFRYLIKQRGGMLAKGWLMGLQFEALLQDSLYFEIAAHADVMADRIRGALQDRGYPIVIPGTTNQIFVVLPDAFCKKIENEFSFSPWSKTDDEHTLVRFCTSWATTLESVDALCNAIRNS